MSRRRLRQKFSRCNRKDLADEHTLKIELDAAGLPFVCGRGAVGRGKIDRRRRRVAETAGIDRVERRPVTGGEENSATQKP